jgi:hypothetical protein
LAEQVGVVRLIALHKAVADRVGAAVPRLNTTWFPSARVTPPLFTMVMPERIRYSLTYGRTGMDEYTLYGTLLVPYADPESGMTALGRYCDREGEESIPAAVESGDWTGVADSIEVTDCEFDYEPMAADQFMAAMFTMIARGRGST